MKAIVDADLITSAAELESLYAAPSERARAKQIDHLDEHCTAFIAGARLLLLATCGNGGADCSPRGGEPGFVTVPDSKTLLLPDHSGNNRLDSLRNIIDNPSVGVLFIVPGVDETLRVNGTASISRSASLREGFGSAGKLPRTVVVVHVREAFIQCSKALVRADCWNPAAFVERSRLPSLGTILAAHTRGAVDAGTYDRQADARIRATLY